MPLQPPEQFPTISVLALPVVVIVSPPPVMLIASDALELTITPQPLEIDVVPVMRIDWLAVGLSVITHPPDVASLAPVVARATIVAVGKPSTAEKSCGMSSLTRATTQ